jgi:MscS family membrane protein
MFKKILSNFISHFIFRLINKSQNLEIESFDKLVIRPLSLLILITFIYFGSNFLNFPEQLAFLDINGLSLESILQHAISIIFIYAFVKLGLRLADYIGIILSSKAKLTNSKMDDQLVPFAIDFIKISVYIIALFYLLGNIFNIDVTTLATGLGIGGLAVAMASKESLENLLGSFTIFFDKPFLVGDIISIGSTTGVVEKVGFRSTRIKTFDQSIVTVPNKNLISTELDNHGLRKVRRSKFMIGLTYDSSIDQIKDIVFDIQKLLDDHTKTNQDGIVRFQEFGASSLDILIIYYVNSNRWEDFIDVKQDINYKIMEIVEKHHCDFAFPSTTVYLQNQKN